jgi:hypothetical protein
MRGKYLKKGPARRKTLPRTAIVVCKRNVES